MKKVLIFLLTAAILCTMVLPALAAKTKTYPEGEPVEIELESGAKVTLTPITGEGFKAQSDKIILHTSRGTTVHNSGSQFLPGSSLSLGTMRGTKPYSNNLMVACKYETELDDDAAIAAVAGIGSLALLKIGEEEYAPVLIWSGKGTACFFYNAEPMDTVLPVFTVNDGFLDITIEP